MATTDEIKVVVTGEDKASGVLSKIGTATGKLGSAFSTLAKVGIAGATAAIGGLVAVGVTSIKAFDEQDKAIKQLEAVLNSTKNAAGLTKDQLLDMASAFQRTTTFSDEAVLSMQNVLLTFTNIKGSAVKDATQAVLDMSTALGTDLQSSAIQVGKALQDPIQGVSALRRVGVNFTEDQQRMIKSLVDTGHAMEAQQFILKELNTEFGGSAAKATETFSGKMAQLKNAIGEIQETIGGALVTAIMPFITTLSNWASNPDVQQKFKEMGEGIANFLNNLKQIPDTIKDIVKGTEEWYDKVSTQNPVIIAILESLKSSWEQVWTTIKNELLPAIQQFIDMLEPHLPLIKEFVKALAQVFGTALVVAILLVVKGLAGLISTIAEMLAIGIKLTTWLTDKAISYFDKWVERIAKAIDAVRRLIAAVKDLSSGGISGAASKVGNGIANIFRASGGPVSANSPYIVGEDGPELFVPDSRGSIVPNNRLGGGGVVFNITGTFLSEDAAYKMADVIMDRLKLQVRL